LHLCLPPSLLPFCSSLLRLLRWPFARPAGYALLSFVLVIGCWRDESLTVCMLLLFSPSTVAFHMFDVHGAGVITKEDVTKVLDSFYKLVGPLVTFSGKKYESHEQLVEEF